LLDFKVFLDPNHGSSDDEMARHASSSRARAQPGGSGRTFGKGRGHQLVLFYKGQANTRGGLVALPDR
jgi:hypothetical protein